MKVKYTKFQVALEIVGSLLLLGMIIFIFAKWNQIPDQVSGHYNAMGEIDRWGNKIEIIIMPLIAIFIYAMITGFSFFPQTWNIPVKISDFNKEEIYKYAMSLLIFMKVEVVGIFFYLTYFTVTAQPLPSYFLPAQLLVIFATLIYFIILMSKAGKKKR